MTLCESRETCYAVDMVDVTDNDALERWFEQKNRDVASVIAARCALRVFPQLNALLLGQESPAYPPKIIILQSFWAISISLSVNTWSDQTIGLQANLAANAAFSVGDVAYKYYGANNNAANTAGYAAKARATPYAKDARIAAYNAAQANTNINSSSSLSADVQFIENGGTAYALLQNPVWTAFSRDDDQNNFNNSLSMPNEFYNNWQSLKSHLIDLDEDWEVWTNWYEDRLRGNIALIEVIETGNLEQQKYGRATFPAKWYKKPVILNAYLKKMIDRYHTGQEQLLTQDTTAEIFDRNENGQIDIKTQQVGEGLYISPTQQEWYDSLREAVEETLAAGQQLGNVKTPLEKVQQALPEDMREARVASLWPRMNKIRRLLKKHEKAAASDEFSLDKIDEDAAIDLEGVVGAFNNLRIGDPHLIAADDNALSPQDTDELKSIADTISPIIIEAIEENLVTEKAAEVLSETQENFSGIDVQNSIMGRAQLTQDGKTQKNFFDLWPKPQETWGEL